MDCEEAPLKRSRFQPTTAAALMPNSIDGVNIPWPMLFPKPSMQEELEMEKILVMNHYESGRGTELPVEVSNIINN